ncbi:hypothetical protein [Rhizobium sp. RCAM05973]|nr:hypothetical protein [Rhizobium sp. RCAM05973]
MLETLDDLAGRPKVGAYGDGAAARTSLDTRTVQALLADPRLSFRLLVGHSKGNLVLSAALHDLCKQDEIRVANLAETMKIVTIGARIAMPPLFTDVVDVMGEWDWFGEINSRPFIHADRRIPHAWHHTNTDLGGHLPVTSTLREILAASPMAADARAEEHPSETSPTATGTIVALSSARPGPRPATIEKIKKAFSAGTLTSTPYIEPGSSEDLQPPKPY